MESIVKLDHMRVDGNPASGPGHVSSEEIDNVKQAHRRVGVCLMMPLLESEDSDDWNRARSLFNSFRKLYPTDDADGFEQAHIEAGLRLLQGKMTKLGGRKDRHNQNLSAVGYVAELDEMKIVTTHEINRDVEEVGYGNMTEEDALQKQNKVCHTDGY